MHLLMHILIDKLRLYLGIHNLLLGIQPVIAGKHVADRTAECIICHSMKAEHLNAEHDGRKRAIRYAAEYRRHAERSRKRRGKPKQWPCHTAEVAPMKKEGTISPPLKPAPKVSAVKRILSRNASPSHPPEMPVR